MQARQGNSGTRIWRFVLLGISLLLPLQGFSREKQSYEDPSSKSWRTGPVRYLMTKAEEKKIKSIKSPEARMKFVKDFWQHRDPTPGTEKNEFRENFLALVEEANREFPSIRGGWSTAQGRILILFGSPEPGGQHIDQNPDGGLKRVRWEYPEDSALGEALTVVFVPDEGGELNLSNIKDVQRILAQNPELLGLGEKRQAQVEPEPVTGAPPETEPSESPAKPGGRITAAANRILEGLVARNTERHEIRLLTRWNFYEAKDITTHCVLTIGVIPPPSLPGSTAAGNGAKELFARIVPSDPVLDTVNLVQSDSFVPAGQMENAPSGPFEIYQARVSLPPGSYQLYAGVRNRDDGRAGTLLEAIEIPDFTSTELSLSTITLANMIQPVNPVPEGPELATYIFGNTRVIPRIELVYRSSEDLSFYFQVYNAKKDPATSKPRLDVEYQFLMKRGSRYQVAAKVPKPGQELGAMGFSLPLQGWPATDYRLRVTVTDRVGGGTATREIDFKVR